jgi:hypothetical protein
VNLVEPYTYVRAITLGLGTIWTIGGMFRTYRFYCRWRDRLVPLGFEKPWLRLQVRTFVLRTTVLDPVNLGLVMVLLGVWVALALVRS